MKHKNIFLQFALACCILYMGACNKPNNLPAPALRIYKLKGDYIHNVCVGLSKDKTRIVAYPSPSGNCGDTATSPFTMKDGYYLDGCCTYGVNSAYLSVTKAEYQKMYPLSRDSMYSLILDKDPYAEFYIDEDNVLEIKEIPDTTHYFTLDTALLNDIITRKELDVYFKKLK
ncbi:MAG: hypothetical protein ACOCWB_01685 [Bacteroidota bacterium]